MSQAGAVRCCFPSHSPISETFFRGLEIITRNQSSCTLLFLIPKSKMILAKKRNALQVCDSPAWETIPSHSQPHSGLPVWVHGKEGALKRRARLFWRRMGQSCLSPALGSSGHCLDSGIDFKSWLFGQVKALE